MSDLTPFISASPSVEDCWRGVVLYGKNTASYKFALASALLELKPLSGQLVKLEDLAPVFARNVAQHLAHSPKQITTTNGKFIQACLAYNNDQKLQPLVDTTVSHGFANVIDAFHVVANSTVAHQFYVDERKANGGIRITDEFSKLSAGIQAASLPVEVESRWRLVETAWNLGISANLLSVQHDHELGELFTMDSGRRRRTVTSSRSALNGYQKGKCFYCSSDLMLSGSEANVDVDHFFPHRLKQAEASVNIDGVWNLVLSCKTCNRGSHGKFDRIPSAQLLQRLHHRNEWFVGSHHPLRETVMHQTGPTTTHRLAFLGNFYQRVQLSPSTAWEPKDAHPALF